MTFTTVPVPVAGPSYQSRSRPLSSQATINFYQQFDESGKEAFVLHSWPGQTLEGAVTGADRGQHVMAGVKYRVAGSKLYEIQTNGNHIDRGLIAGTARCIFANDGENMFIVNAGNVQQYSALTNTLSNVTDSNIVGSIAVDFINSQFIYTKPDLFIISDVGDGSSASGLNAAQAESQPDDLVRCFIFDGMAHMFGTLTKEPWYNDGEGSPPFQRIDGQIISIGLAALHSLASNDNLMYWLGDDRQIYQSTRSTANRISSKAISHAIEGYDVVSDAVGWTMTFEGQNFYVITFPTENATWVVNEELGENGWFQLSGDTNQGKYNSTSYVSLDGEHFVADETDGNLYKLDIDTFTNNGETIQRTRVMTAITGRNLGKQFSNKTIQMSRFELDMERGVGVISGQGEDPKVMIEASYDGGKSFEAGTWMRIGRLGETNIKLRWDNLKVFDSIIIRLTTSDPVDYTIMSGAIDLRLAGN